MMPRAPDAGSTVSWALGLSRRHSVIRRTPFAFRPGSVWQACELTAAQKAEARRRRAQGATLAELARSYGVGKSTISRL
jgi:hypothetical protein